MYHQDKKWCAIIQPVLDDNRWVGVHDLEWLIDSFGRCLPGLGLEEREPEAMLAQQNYQQLVLSSYLGDTRKRTWSICPWPGDECWSNIRRLT
jgi:hypothetical protein